MFDIGFPELMLSAIVGLLVIGPERLPEALRTLGLWLGRMRRSFQSVKAEIEKEIGMDEVRKQLHNEAVMDEMKRIEREVKATVNVAAQAARIDDIDPPSSQAVEAPSQAVEAPSQAVEAPLQAARAPSAEPLQGPPKEAERPGAV